MKSLLLTITIFAVVGVTAVVTRAAGDHHRKHVTGRRVTITSNLQLFRTKTRIVADDGKPYWSNNGSPEGPARRLDRLKLRCHGGLTEITWETGDLEPTHPNTGIHISIRLDGRKLATLLKGGTRGVWNDGPAYLTAVTHCHPGTHTVVATIDSITGEWGIPYADPTDRVPRGFIVREVWKKV